MPSAGLREGGQLATDQPNGRCCFCACHVLDLSSRSLSSLAGANAAPQPRPFFLFRIHHAHAPTCLDGHRDVSALRGLAFALGAGNAGAAALLSRIQRTGPPDGGQRRRARGGRGRRKMTRIRRQEGEQWLGGARCESRLRAIETTACY